eukprot:4878002-Pleurochrysis_carterae.AAC.1
MVSTVRCARLTKYGRRCAALPQLSKEEMLRCGRVVAAGGTAACTRKRIRPLSKIRRADARNARTEVDPTACALNSALTWSLARASTFRHHGAGLPHCLRLVNGFEPAFEPSYLPSCAAQASLRCFFGVLSRMTWNPELQKREDERTWDEKNRLERKQQERARPRREAGSSLPALTSAAMISLLRVSFVAMPEPISIPSRRSVP